MRDHVIVSVGEAKLVEPAISFDALFEPSTARVLENMKQQYLEYVEKATSKLISAYQHTKDEATEVICYASYHVIVRVDGAVRRRWDLPTRAGRSPAISWT